MINLFCSECGTKNIEAAAFCKNCGAKIIKRDLSETMIKEDYKEIGTPILDPIESIKPKKSVEQPQKVIIRPADNQSTPKKEKDSFK